MLNTVLKNFRLFFQGVLLSYIALFRWLQPMIYLATKIVGPLFQMLFFTFLGMFATGQENAHFYIIGNAVQVTALSGIFGVTLSITGDRWEGTLPYLFGTPANRLTLFLGRAFMHVIDGMLGVVIGLTWGVLLLNLDLSNTNPASLGLTIFITSFSTVGMGLVLGCLGLITRNVMFINNTVYFLLLIFSGANIPITSLPGWMQTISHGIPLTRGIAAAREIIAGENFSSIAPLMREEILIGLIYIFLGYMLFRWFESQAKRRGTLEVI
jgi:ABC-2 type transport system permease protein